MTWMPVFKLLIFSQDALSESTPTPFWMLLPARVVAQMVKLKFPMNVTSEPAQNKRADVCHRDGGESGLNIAPRVDMTMSLSESKILGA